MGIDNNIMVCWSWSTYMLQLEFSLPRSLLQFILWTKLLLCITQYALRLPSLITGSLILTHTGTQNMWSDKTDGYIYIDIIFALLLQLSYVHTYYHACTICTIMHELDISKCTVVGHVLIHTEQSWVLGYWIVMWRQTMSQKIRIVHLYSKCFKTDF